MNYEKAFYFLVGVAAGAAGVCFLKSETGRKAAVAITSKGLELKDRVATMAERVKETTSDIVAEAKYVNESKSEAK
ncbi:MAG: DUF1490 family protein [Synergistaceae bacterium]|jgi:hypothetical protein|nr:DUF1490 family protein [Synergistaceae bacterium]